MANVHPKAGVGCGEFTNRTNRERCGARCLPHPTELGPAADGEVLDGSGQAKRLYQLMGDKPILLSFIYAACSDANGCPLATRVLHQIAKRLQAQPALAGQLRLLTLSFNPQHDTPEHMRRYGAGIAPPGFDWRFLTARDEQALQPILDGYRHQVQKIYDAQGQFTGTFSHLLRVYLIDRDKQIRNIYGTDLLHADTVLNDVQTLLLAAKPPASAPATTNNTTRNAITAPIRWPWRNARAGRPICLVLPKNRRWACPNCRYPKTTR